MLASPEIGSFGLASFSEYFSDDLLAGASGSADEVLFAAMQALCEIGFITASESGGGWRLRATPTHAARLAPLVAADADVATIAQGPYTAFTTTPGPSPAALSAALERRAYFLWRVAEFTPAEPRVPEALKAFPEVRPVRSELSASRLSVAQTVAVQRGVVSSSLDKLVALHRRAPAPLRLLLLDPAAQTRIMVDLAVQAAFDVAALPPAGQQAADELGEVSPQAHAAVQARDLVLDALFEAAALPAPGPRALELKADAWSVRARVALANCMVMGVCTVGMEKDVFVLRPTVTTGGLVASATDEAPLTVAQAQARATKVPAPTDGACVLVENNFKLYAYVNCPDDIAVVRLISLVRTQAPGILAGQITDFAFLRANANGITADDIIGWLRRHVHPARALTKEVLDIDRAGPGALCALPVNVEDQLRLWEGVFDCLRATPGRLLSGLNSDQRERLVQAALADAPADDEPRHPWLLWPSTRLLRRRKIELQQLAVVDDDQIEAAIRAVAAGAATSVVRAKRE